MPPALSDIEDDSGSDGTDAIPSRPAKKAVAKAEAADVFDEEDVDNEVENAAAVVQSAGAEDEEEDDDDEEEEDIYTVEKIVSHEWAPDGTPIYQVKWLGYNKASDRTWEPETNLEGAMDVLDAYHRKIGGRPEPKSPEQPKGKGKGKGKRKRQSDTTAEAPANKKGTNGTVRKPFEMPDGSWEDAIAAISTIEEMSEREQKVKGRLQAYVDLQNGEKRMYSMATIRQKCPQTLIDYYEQHLYVCKREIPSP